MSIIEVGARVYAVESVDGRAVRLYGFGTLMGFEAPPAAVRQADVTSLPGFLALNAELPKIVLDDGQVVWGCQCWWGPEVFYASLRGAREEVRVPVP